MLVLGALKQRSSLNSIKGNCLSSLKWRETEAEIQNDFTQHWMIQSCCRIRGCAWFLCPLRMPWAMLPLAAKMCLDSCGWPRAKCLYNMCRWSLWMYFHWAIPSGSAAEWLHLIRRPLPSPPHLRVSSARLLPQQFCFLSQRLHCAIKLTPSVVRVCFWHRYLLSPTGPASFPSFKESSALSFIHHHQQCTDINKTQTDRMMIVGYVK